MQFFKSTPEKTLIIAYSGGVDSQVLLCALAKLKQQGQLDNNLVVCHVNHGLSPDADAWQAFAKNQCERFSLPLITHKLQLKKQAQQSLEAIARDARYTLLSQASEESAIIVTGHHLNDQAETFLLALKRGAGLKGLSAMPARLTLGQHSLARPLLTIARADIIAYANQHQLKWIEDESNQDQAFDRNFLRHTVLPELENRWPSFSHTLSRSAGHCQDAQALLEELAETDLAKVSEAEHVLSVPSLLALSPLRFNNVVRHFLAQHHKLMPSRAQLLQIFQQLSTPKDKNPTVKIGDYSLRRFGQQLHLTANFQNIAAWQTQLPQQTEPAKIDLPDGLGQILVSKEFEAVDKENMATQTSALVDKENLRVVELCLPTPKQVVSIRFHHDNPTCLPHFRDKSRALKKILQEAKIPTWQRQRIPFVYYDDTLVAALGLFICKSYLPLKSNSKLKLVWLDDQTSG